MRWPGSARKMIRFHEDQSMANTSFRYRNSMLTSTIYTEFLFRKSNFLGVEAASVETDDRRIILYAFAAMASYGC
jgi:hypothetical protein